MLKSAMLEVSGTALPVPLPAVGVLLAAFGGLAVVRRRKAVA